ncbi:MAG: response regulator [Candidatus Heimdallarchaeota archaeon]
MDKKTKILVMDDDNNTREVLGEILKTLGYDPHFAKDGEEAYELYKDSMNESKKFNVVLMDLNVKQGIGGVEGAKKLISIDPQAKVIVTSGHFDVPLQRNLKEHGFSGMLLKPFKINELKKKLNDSIKPS